MLLPSSCIRKKRGHGMKHFTLIACFISVLLLLIVAVPVSAALSLSPHVGYTGKTMTVTITGTNFTAGGNLSGTGGVRLEMSGESDITGSSISTWNDTAIVCKFKIGSTKETGDWDLVVTKTDDSEITKSDAFTILDPMVLTSISPTEARVNTDEVEFTVRGTGLADVDELYLYNADYDNITADLDDVEDTKITGTFDLTDTDEDTYDVCVVDDYETEECDLSFKIITDAVGSIYFQTNPDGARVFLDDTEVGTSTFTYLNASPGTHSVRIQKTGYTDYTDTVTVVENKRTTYYARLTALTTATATTAATTAKTATTVRKSTLQVPTSWPSATPTEESPVDPALIIGAAGIGLCLAFLRKH